MYKKWIKNLNDNELFKNIEEEELITILSCMQPVIKSFKKKDIIVIEKETISAIGIVLEGEIIVSKEDDAGERVIMAKLKQGDMFGEIGAYSNHIWPASVAADTNCTILFLSPEKVVKICEKVCIGHRMLIENMLAIIARKALKLNNKVEILTMKSVRKKISHYLLAQSLKSKSLVFEIPLKRIELAEYLDITRPSLSRELIRMQEEGIIHFQKNKFEIHSIERLKG